MPRVIPDDQNETLRVYKKGTHVTKLIAAVRRAGDVDQDQVIRDAAGDDAKVTLQEIREMVCA